MIIVSLVPTRHFAMKKRIIPLLIILFTTPSCEPIYAFAWTRDFDHPVDILCVENSLKSLTADIYKGDYISTGDRGFPKGVKVTQFTYLDPGHKGAFSYDVAKIDLTHTHVYHVFEKTGNRPTDDYVQKSVDLLNYNNNRIANSCNLLFSEKDFEKPWYFR